MQVQLTFPAKHTKGRECLITMLQLQNCHNHNVCHKRSGTRCMSLAADCEVMSSQWSQWANTRCCIMFCATFSYYSAQLKICNIQCTAAASRNNHTNTKIPANFHLTTMSSNDAQIEQELKVVQKMYEDSFITREQLSKIQSVIFNHTAPTSIAASDDTNRVLRSNSNVTIRPRKRALDRCQINFAQVG